MKFDEDQLEYAGEDTDPQFTEEVGEMDDGGVAFETSGDGLDETIFPVNADSAEGFASEDQLYHEGDESIDKSMEETQEGASNLDDFNFMLDEEEEEMIYEEAVPNRGNQVSNFLP